MTPALRLLLCAALSPCALPQARAVALDIVNPGFESPATDPGTFQTNSAPPGWSAYGDLDFGLRTIGVVNPNSTTLYLDPVPEGSNVGVVFLAHTFQNVESGMVQTLSATLQTHTVYTLTVEVGNMNNDSNFPHNQFEFSGFPGYRVDLLAGGAVVASDNNTLLPGEGRFLTSTVQLSVGASHALVGQNLGIRLVNLDSAGGIEVNFDDVRLDATAIPEPAAAAGLLGGALLFGTLAARRRVRG